MEVYIGIGQHCAADALVLTHQAISIHKTDLVPIIPFLLSKSFLYIVGTHWWSESCSSCLRVNPSKFITVLAHGKHSPFLGYHNSQQLVLEALGGDHEVEQRHFGSHLGQVVRVAELGGDVEPEVMRVLNDVLTQADHVHSTCTTMRAWIRLNLKGHIPYRQAHG